MKLFRKLILMSAASFAVIPSVSVADILIAPTRVVMEQGERSAELVFINKGGEEAAFRISIENRRMLMDGSMEKADESQPGELFAKDFLRYSPRRVVLEPNGQQMIRLSARLPKGIAPGEYRSHLRIMSAPVSAGSSLQAVSNDADSNQLSITLVAIQSVTIPVIVRVGELDANVEISALSVESGETNSETYLVAKMERDGAKSTYGDIKIFTDDTPEPVYFARGIAVYVPNKEREVVLPLPTEVREKIQGKNVRIVYASSDPENPGNIAEFSTRLP